MTTTAPSPSSERRSRPRAEVAIWVEERTQDALYFQHATNLSLGGVWLDGTLPHPPGKRVALDIELPGDGSLRVTGEVVLHKPGQQGMAIRFVDLDDHAKARLTAFLDRTLKRRPGSLPPS
ncbi:MAG: PilZ domain-containing protein [Polyangiaceae bacterium]